MSTWLFRSCSARERKLTRTLGLHYHCYLERKLRFQTRDVRRFDIGGHHPNIRVVRQRAGAIEYAAKDGDFVSSDGLRVFDTSANFVRKFADFQAWTSYATARFAPLPAAGLVAPDGVPLCGPDPRDKRRHLLLHGPPSTGKSYWLDTQFGGKRVFHVPKSGYQFDSYWAQPWIVFDDAEPFPGKGLLTTLTESSRFTRYLPARYNNRVLPAGWCACVVIACNTEDIPVTNGVSFLNQSWFTERFHIVHVVQGMIPLPPQ